jgi:putative ABC transport system permease protein
LPIVGTQGEQVAKVKIVGLYGESQLMGTVVLSAATLEGTAYEAAQNTFAMLVDGESENLRADLEKTVADYLVVRVQTAEEFAGEQVAMINQMLYILYALLGLSVIVAILGIINTLALNVIERRQEIGMLRAVGTARRQVRTMITVESVQIAIYGALVGIIVGVGLGWAFLKVLAGQGLDKLTIPWEMLGLMLVASAVVGVVAALWPAAKASRTPPLEAIAD